MSTNMPEDRPTSTQCTARSKQTGQRCRRRIPGDLPGVCRSHGGAAPQVRRRREANLAIREVAARVMADDRLAGLDPAERMLNALATADAVLERLKLRASAGESHTAELLLLGDWLDRVSRLARVAFDVDAKGRAERIEREARRMAAEEVAEDIERALAEFGIDARVPANAARLARAFGATLDDAHTSRTPES